MPIRYAIDLTKGYICEVWSGTVSIEDLRAYWVLMLADPEAMKLRRTLVDLRNTEIKFNGQELDIAIQELVLPRLNGLDWKTALVVSDPVQYGVSRQYQMFADIYSKDSIFFDTETAEAWLRNL